MRLFLLPISTRRTLIYCERSSPAPTASNTSQPPLSERIITRASTTWATWEKAEKGWQKNITVYGNQLFKRIPFEEWGLKSLPPATKKRLEEVDAGNLKFECLFPGRFLEAGKVPELLKRLGSERQALHRRRMWTSIALMPVSAPFTLVPVIPNLPFFYLCFRAYSHYRALYGSKMLEHLTARSLITPTPSKEMDEAYTAGLLHPTREKLRAEPAPSAGDMNTVVTDIEARTQEAQKKLGEKGEVMLLQRWNGKLIAEKFTLPEMEVEIERAVEQVEKAVKMAEEEKTKGGASPLPTQADEKSSGKS